jgi:NAD(P)H-hydrate epimerase
MRAIEQSSVEAGVSLDELMENAGLAVAKVVRADFDESGGAFGKRIVILIGPGNNGAGGFVVGRHLAAWGTKVTAVLCAGRDSPDPKSDRAEQAGVLLIDGLSDDGLQSLQQKLETTDAVIDAVLGIGSSRPIAEPLSSLLSAVGESEVPVVALDLPTGLNSDTGTFDGAGLPADQTLMLGYPKLGPAISADPAVTCEVVVLDIGIPGGLDSQVETELLTAELAALTHPKRPHDGHKGTFGSALIIGGSQEYLGGVTMATDAATRSGVGLTFVATPEPAYRQIAGDVPEAMYRSLPVAPDGKLAPSKSAQIALELSGRSKSVTIGPGLGDNANTAEFLSILLAQMDPTTPLVLDADALNILSKSHQWWE